MTTVVQGIEPWHADRPAVRLFESEPWEERALCSIDGDIWFADPFTPEEQQAMAFCSYCPVREMCLAKAKAINEDPSQYPVEFGVWGGERFYPAGEICKAGLHMMSDDNQVAVSNGKQIVIACMACRRATKNRSRAERRANGRTDAA